MAVLLSACLVAALLLQPSLAEACFVCMTGREDDTRRAFLWTTGALSLLPLAMLGGFGLYLWRRARALTAAAQSGAEAPAQVEAVGGSATPQ